MSIHESFSQINALGLGGPDTFQDSLGHPLCEKYMKWKMKKTTLDFFWYKLRQIFKHFFWHFLKILGHTYIPKYIYNYLIFFSLFFRIFLCFIMSFKQFTYMDCTYSILLEKILAKMTLSGLKAILIAFQCFLIVNILYQTLMLLYYSNFSF